MDVQNIKAIITEKLLLVHKVLWGFLDTWGEKQNRTKFEEKMPQYLYNVFFTRGGNLSRDVHPNICFTIQLMINANCSLLTESDILD